MQAEVILASLNQEMPDEAPLVTMRLRYPRFIHAEVMTHRVFGRNARSSRAVPVKRMIEEIEENPVVPWHWGKNQRGMQADTECDAKVLIDWDHEIGHENWVAREDAWREARDHAVRIARGFSDAGYHKQVVNRLLEPFMWIDVLITANRWQNFLWLRDHKDAEPHLRDLAVLVKRALGDAEMQNLAPGYWHLPYIAPEEYRNGSWKNFEERVEFLSKISAARCARISYTPFDGDASYERELERYNMLVTSERVHASPLEHQAMPDECVLCPTTGARERWMNPEKHGNLPGWIQARKLVPNEAKHG
jgi:thymidylate synthase ThyX